MYHHPFYNIVQELHVTPTTPTAHSIDIAFCTFAHIDYGVLWHGTADVERLEPIRDTIIYVLAIVQEFPINNFKLFFFFAGVESSGGGYVGTLQQRCYPIKLLVREYRL